ncbi:4-hydroxy-tetrahydrodipicolinate reductase [Marinisporobacter balticus]|uniref:4-hydroxy-tetrahydrodipicolinate reductase n=1 Tax=Marinisporobacter balticus TaxID=2018667 RepID=A0A4R2KGC9_9FIRM|nr:4-hydroxy-tetrahydrodipicolinate reductase [Marinisporobacter balticus]TCO71452.1 dihydrodipicolinate reductase [Marinisporobacter balticus]
MIKVIVNGCNGKMGNILVKSVNNDEEVIVVAGIDRNINKQNHPFPVYSHPSKCLEKGDVLIDFSHHSLISDVLNYCVHTKTPLVLATSGIASDQKEQLLTASHAIPILQSPNMSLGVNVIIDLVKKATETLGHSFDIEIVEKYHNKKVDSPSGTTLMLANGIKDTFKEQTHFIFGRHGNNDDRKDTDIGIHSVRGGTFMGEHTILFAGADEVVEITHKALSKDIFALGAIKAAKFLVDKKNGFYTMNDLLK